ncbi:hypothetical protein CALCODRAFT_69885 [Calocera cornea HHB12733]|uniref:Protein PBN1 n=1 Tax=Calocera cornea HHB12733 TaxID=1353952 RepID=A0A165DIY7_9BASI|nr:hypothetical protein CALCODRAFT_69885 [Calocera cornea HHB12733]
MLPLSLILLVLAWPVAANTEIVNFLGGEHEGILMAEGEHLQWPRLQYTAQANQVLTISPAPVPEGTPWEDVFPPDGERAFLLHELWVVLDLDTFPTSSFWDQQMYTLRLSWPAWSPVEFQLNVYDPDLLPRKLRGRSRHGNGQLTRNHFARIRAKNAGIHRNETFQQGQVKFALELEKLHFGFLPPSVMPALLVILASLVPSYAVARYILRILSPISERSSHELRNTTKSDKDD